MNLWKQSFKELFIGLSILMGVVVISTVFGNTSQKPSVITTPQMALEAMRKLENEYIRLDSLPGSSRKKYASSHRSQNALVQATYYTDKDYNDIRLFYLETALQNGWMLAREGAFEGVFYYKPGENLIFIKDEYKLEISYYRKKYEDGSNLVINLTWNQ